MPKPQPSKTASQLQDEMDQEIAKIDKKYLKLIAPHEKEIAKLKKSQDREKSQVENKYIKLIEALDPKDLDISFAKADINTDVFGDYS